MICSLARITLSRGGAHPDRACRGWVHDAFRGAPLHFQAALTYKGRLFGFRLRNVLRGEAVLCLVQALSVVCSNSGKCLIFK